MSKKNEKVFGLIGIESIMANWNADFTGYPRTTSDDHIFGTDKAIKYAIRNFWNDKNEKLLCFKEYREDIQKKKKDAPSVTIIPMSLDEKFMRDFKITKNDLKTMNHADVLKNILTYIDVKNFGVTFAVKDTCSLSITGTVQYGHGFNIMPDTEPIELQIQSQFRNSNEKATNNASTTLGSEIIADEAHYLYSFVVNPLMYKNQTSILDGKVDDDSILYYTEEDYNKFKKAALLCATNLNSCSKKGCNNEFALFIETEEDTYLPDLSSYVKFEKDDKNIYSINIKSLTDDLDDKIKKIEVFYNTNTIKIDGDILDNPKTKLFNIFTNKEVRK